MPPHIDLIRVSDRRRVPWKNGAGFTEEIAADPRWRISVADLGDSTTLFSAFDGRARIFTVIGDHGVTFDIDGRQTAIAPLDPYAFDGALTPTCIPKGHTRALNVMVDDASLTATVKTLNLPGQELTTNPAAITAVYVHSGCIDTAGPGDCMLVRHQAVEITGVATVLVAEIRESRRREPGATA